MKNHCKSAFICVPTAIFMRLYHFYFSC